MPQIAILILCHRLEAAQYLIDLFDARFLVIVHVDAHTEMAATSLRLPPYARLLEPRWAIFWGGFNMIQASRALIQRAREEVPGLRRYVLLSGDSLPVAPLDQLVARLLDERVEYIGMMPVPNDPSLRGVSPDDCVQRYQWVQPWRFHNFVCRDTVITGVRKFPQLVKKYGLTPEAAARLQRDAADEISQPLLAQLPPRPALFDAFYFGDQWWALSAVAISLIYDDMFADDVSDYFRYFDVPDESFFQCLLGRHLSLLQGLGHHCQWNLMFVDHADPVRQQFGDDALPSAAFFDCHARTGKLFARKFNPKRAPEVRAALEDGSYFSRLAPSAD